MAGFRDEDDDLGDLLPPPTMTSSTYAFAADQDEEDLSASPWGDSTSSSTVYNPPSFAAYEQQRSPEPSTSSLPPTTPSYDDEPRHFTRESAPEPETPAYSRRASSTYNYDGGFSQDTSSSPAPTSPFQAPYSPPAITEQTPFGSPPISPTRGPYASHTRQASKPDLSALLGEEKPILPKFAPRRETPEGVAGPLGSKIAVLPVSSIGKKPVGGALATLLGLEVEEEEKEKVAAGKKGKEDVKTDGAATKAAGEATSAEAAASQPPAGTSSEAAAASADPASDSTAIPAPIASTSAETPTAETPTASDPPSDAPASLPPPVLVALSTPLPPSPSVSPPPPSADSSTLAPKRSSLSRASSRAASTRTIDSSEGVNAYDSIVSPMEAEGAVEAWPGEEGKESIDGLEQKLEALKVDTTSKVAEDEDSSMAASEPTPTESTGEPLPSEPALATPTPSTPPTVAAASLPAADEPDLFAQYTYASEAPSSVVSSARPSLFEAPISPTTNRGFRSHNGSTDEGVFGGADDAASLRGAYSRSVEVSETGEEARESMDVERAGVTSPPLPPLPTMGSPSIQQTSPRSTEMGGSLGPTTIISVGDPQTIGSSLNPAAQHTVYTVRTRTTSKAFRKSDFSVLRRFSHFLWLFDALTLNNPGVIVPGMPEKSAMGRFGHEFVENRRSGLQAALMKIVSHPMLVGDPDLRLFLESDTFSIDIKQRKLDGAAESKGLFASLTGAISGPTFHEFDEFFDTRRQILDGFETQLKSLLHSLSAAAKVRHALQGSLGELQGAFLGLAQCDLSPSLRKALEDAARVQEKLRQLSEEQSQSEDQIGGLNSVAEGYARLCASARLVFSARIKAYHVWQTAESSLRKTKAAHDKSKKSGRTHSELLGLAVSEIAEAERKMLDAKQDFEDVSKLTKAEMARFDKEKIEDFKKAIEDYADGMAARQREVVSAWQVYHDMLVNVVAANTQPSPSVAGGAPQAVEQ